MCVFKIFDVQNLFHYEQQREKCKDTKKELPIVVLFVVFSDGEPEPEPEPEEPDIFGSKEGAKSRAKIKL